MSKQKLGTLTNQNLQQNLQNIVIPKNHPSTETEVPVPVESLPSENPVSNTAIETKGITIRMSKEVWKELKMLSIEEDKTAQKLLIEAINELFKKYGRPPIAV